MSLEQGRYYSYEEWLNFDDDMRTELYNGQIFMMASPSDEHQAASVEISRQLANFLIDKTCRVFTAFDVRLYKDEDTALQPDIIVVCDRNKITRRCCEGAPDLVIEILSPSTRARDFLIKYKEYQRAGVKEYWIVDTEIKKVFVNILTDKVYELIEYDEADNIPVHVLPDCEIYLPFVFREQRDVL